MSVFPVLFTTKSIGHRGLHQAYADVRSSREGTCCVARGSVSVDRIASVRVRILPRVDEWRFKLPYCYV